MHCWIKRQLNASKMKIIPTSAFHSEYYWHGTLNRFMKCLWALKKQRALGGENNTGLQDKQESWHECIAIAITTDNLTPPRAGFKMQIQTTLIKDKVIDILPWILVWHCDSFCKLLAWYYYPKHKSYPTRQTTIRALSIKFKSLHQNYLEKVLHLLYNLGTDYSKTRTFFTEIKAQRGIKTQ
jgi:hypothetical protein